MLQEELEKVLIIIYYFYSLIIELSSKNTLGCARALADHGATVYITGRKKETLEATANELGKNCRAIVCDHAEADQIEQLFNQISEENNG